MTQQTILYAVLNAIGLLAAFIVARTIPFPKSQRTVSRGMFAFVLVGAILGTKIPVWCSYGFAPEYFWDGKSLFGGLLGGFLAMNLFKMAWRIPGSGFGDRFVIPLCVAAGFGKIGCWFHGCCGGHPFGGFVPPTQLFESAFQFLAAGFFVICYRRQIFAGLWFPVYMVLYMTMRFFMEFLRSEPTFCGPLTVYQILALVFLPVFGRIVALRLFGERRFRSGG